MPDHVFHFKETYLNLMRIISRSKIYFWVLNILILLHIFSFFIDYFTENNEVKKVNLLNFSHQISFVLEKENVILLKVFSIKIENLDDVGKEKVRNIKETT